MEGGGTKERCSPCSELHSCPGSTAVLSNGNAAAAAAEDDDDDVPDVPDVAIANDAGGGGNID